MAAQGGGKSKWGSFLSQAVANVESRLDNILAEDEQQLLLQQQQQQQQQQKPNQSPSPAPTQQQSKSEAPTGKPQVVLDARMIRGRLY